jgi:alkanesulfonate monooxygenase SsuD/methylene tetrahydromethanopterin reductase-like flavin-dependent oxidoreductase (luciferase family)
MHVGMAAIFQGSEERDDHTVYRDELRLADLAEPLGFESIWGVEHHFTEYTMCPDVVQFLTYMAGRTSTVQLGSMVVVLPWHDPVRVAEEVTMLDHLSDGRMIFGMGRGLGRVEFGGFRVPMDESRGRFVEAAELILAGLEQGYVKYEGEFYSQPHRELRPAPLKSFKGRTYAAAVSPESSRIMAELGVGILIIPQKPWDSAMAELDNYRQLFREINQAEPPPTITAGWVFCDEDGDRAREMAKRYIGAYYESVLRHYELAGSHLQDTKGYEYYSGISQALNKYGDQVGIDFFVDLQVYGTPDECYEKVLAIRSMVGNETFVGVFAYGDLPIEEAERNMRLFAAEVKPRLQSLPSD